MPNSSGRKVGTSNGDGAPRRQDPLARQFAVLDHVLDPVFVWELSGPIIYWNDAAEQTYGYTRAEAFGRISHELLRTEFPNGLTAPEIEQMVARDEVWTGEIIHWKKDGGRLIIDTRHKLALLDEPGSSSASHPQRFVIEANRDVTAQRRTQEEIARYARQQEDLAVLSRSALEHDCNVLVRDAVKRIVNELHVGHAQILAFDAAHRTFSFYAGKGWLSDAMDQGALAAALTPQSAFTIAAGEPVVVPDFASERRFTISAALLSAGVGSSVSVVIRAHPNVFGVLSVYDRKRHEFSANQVLYLRSVANVLAGALQNDRSQRDLQDRGARMAAIVDTALEGIITIDERGIIESVNPAGCHLFGYKLEELIGQNVKMLMPEPYQGEHDGYMMNYLRTGRARIIGIGREVSGRRKDGTVFPLHLGVSEFRIGGKRMFTGQVRDITERRRLEREILEIGSQEQLRIGQDLHDGLCQELTGVSFALEVLGQKLAARTAPETASIRKVADLVDQTISHARALAHGLQPVTLDASGLESALQELAAKTEKLFHISCLFVGEGHVLVYDNVIATNVYRIAQEAIGNAIKHGKAKTILLDLGVQASQLCLTVTDDGVGLGKVMGDGKGIGLQTMSYRARIVGGTLEIRPGERGGTIVTCKVPLRQGGKQIKSQERASEDHGGKTQTRQRTASKRRRQSSGGGQSASRSSSGGNGNGDAAR